MISTINEFWSNPHLLALIGETFYLIAAVLISIDIIGIKRIKNIIEKTLIIFRISLLFFIRDPILENPRLKIVRALIVTGIFLIISYLVIFVFKIKKEPEFITFLIVISIFFVFIPVFYTIVDRLLEKTIEKPKFVFGIIGFLFLIFGYIIRLRVNELTIP